MSHVKYLECFKCKAKYPADSLFFECIKCGYSLDIIYDYNKIKKSINKSRFKKQVISHWKYFMFYPIRDLSKIVSLNEGNTSLYLSNSDPNLFFKYEATNPTASFKDRGSSVEITKALELGINHVYCASTGNMGASIAAYAARARIKSTIFVPNFAPKNKFKQIKSYGADIVKVRGTYEDAVKKTIDLRFNKNVYLTGDYPYRCEGQKSVAFEILDQLSFNPPNYIICPIGNGTLIYATYKACYEFKKIGLIKKIPKIIGVQASGCAPVVNAFNKRKRAIKPIKWPKTIASAIACGNPVDGLEALYALRKSKGFALKVSDKEILSAAQDLGKEGLYVEPAGAVSYAGYKKIKSKLNGKVVCILTGHGLKDEKEY